MKSERYRVKLADTKVEVKDDKRCYTEYIKCPGYFDGVNPKYKNDIKVELSEVKGNNEYVVLSYPKGMEKEVLSHFPESEGYKVEDIIRAKDLKDLDLGDTKVEVKDSLDMYEIELSGDFPGPEPEKLDTWQLEEYNEMMEKVKDLDLEIEYVGRDGADFPTYRFKGTLPNLMRFIIEFYYGTQLCKVHPYFYDTIEDLHKA